MNDDIKGAIRAAGMSLGEVAKAMGVCQSSLSRMLRCELTLSERYSIFEALRKVKEGTANKNTKINISGCRLSEEMIDKGITTKELVYISGVPRQTIYNVLNGRYLTVYYNTAKALCDALQCEIRDIFPKDKKEIDFMVNKWIGMGRLTSDPELKQTPNGISCCNITLAVQRDYADNSGQRQSDFLSVVAWKQTAEFISRYFHKGNMIAVEGQLRTRSYADRNHPDVKHYITEVYADKVHFCGSKSDSGGGQAQAPASAQAPVQAVIQQAQTLEISDFEEIAVDGDLPF